MSNLSSHLQQQLDGGQRFFWHRLRWRAIAPYIPSDHGVVVLDVGAGAGITGRYLARHRPRAEYRFIEPLPEMEAHLELEFGRTENARQDTDLSKVTVVTLLDVLEHVDGDVEMLRSVVTRVSPNTRFLITVPALMSLWSEWDVLLGHHRRYDRVGLTRVLRAAGLRIDCMTYLFPELLPAAWWRHRRHPGGAPTRSIAPQPFPETASTEIAEFPTLSRSVDETLFGIGVLSLKLSKWSPAGTSLLAVGRVDL